MNGAPARIYYFLMATIFDWTTLGISAASVFTSILAAAYAKEAVDEARRSSLRTQQEWKQRQWFDLYREADYAYDLLDRFYRLYGTQEPDVEYESSFNDAMAQLRRAHAFAAVFPISTIVTSFFEVSVALDGPADPKFQQRLEMILNAVEGIREQALLDAGVMSQ